MQLRGGDDSENEKQAAVSKSAGLFGMLNSLASFPFHPFVFAATAVLCALNNVKFGMIYQESLPALAILELIVAFVFALALIVFRDRHRAGIAASAFIAWFVLYRALVEALSAALRSAGFASMPGWLCLAVYLALGTVAFYLLLSRRFSTEHHGATPSLNLVSCLILLFNSIPVFLFYAELNDLSKQMQARLTAGLNAGNLEAVHKPDIYFIMADGFPSLLTLKEYWQYDSKQFTEFLRDKNFQIIDNSCSNYDRTFFSLSATMNMQYLDDPVGFYNKHPESMQAYELLIQNNCVLNLLKQMGYKVINFSSGDGATRLMPDALNYSCSPVNIFTIAFFELTPLYSLEPYLHILRNQLALVELCPGRQLSEIAKIEGPKFVFIHTLLPHPPYIFDQVGNPIALDPSLQNEQGTPELFLNQLKFAENELRSWIETIFAAAGQPPVIILQSDHGPEFPTSTLPEFYNQRLRNFAAYHFPGSSVRLDQSMSNVNSFRSLFNVYFNAQLPALENKAFCASNADDFQLKEVYSLLNFEPDRKGLQLKVGDAPAPKPR